MKLFFYCRYSWVFAVAMGLAVTKQEAFWEACGFGNKERVRKFIAEGVDVNWVSYTVSNSHAGFDCAFYGEYVSVVV